MRGGSQGALLIGIVATTGLALATGLAQWPTSRVWFALPRLETFGAADLSAALRWSAVPLVLSLMMVDFFDTLGTATAIVEQAQLTDRDGRVPGLRRLLAVDALGASIGGWFGASSATAYIESAAGVAEGARTGLHSVVVGVLFVFAAFLAPLAAVVPAAATAPALIAVGFLMCTAITRIDFERIDTGLPAFVTLLMVPLTYSIAHGIGYGFLSYVAIAVCRGRARAVHPIMYGVALAFAIFFWGSSSRLRLRRGKRDPTRLRLRLRRGKPSNQRDKFALLCPPLERWTRYAATCCRRCAWPGRSSLPSLGGCSWASSTR